MKQLSDEAELASTTLDRAEAAERELATLRAQLDERRVRASFPYLCRCTVSRLLSGHRSLLCHMLLGDSRCRADRN